MNVRVNTSVRMRVFRTWLARRRLEIQSECSCENFSRNAHLFTTWLVRGGLEVVVVEREAMDRRPLVAEVASLACGRPQRRRNAARCR